MPTNLVLLITFRSTLKSLAKRWRMLSSKLKQLDKQLEQLTQDHAPKLRSRFGVEPNTAAILLSVTVNNPKRLKIEAALA